MTVPAAWTRVRDEAQTCTRCPLYAPATQSVFGEGPVEARIFMVGEQPGDQEDRQGRPFVGPAGKVLDRALAEAGIDRAEVYLTNAVKHFKFTMRGRRRLHQKPDTGEIEACKFWLLQELELLRPPIVVALGATAARAITGRTVTIGRERGRLLPWGGEGQRLLITVHPSFILRVPDPAGQEIEYARFLQDLRLVAPGAPEAAAAPARRRQGSLL
ncbi:MAG TPA: UdgX family uracil-DNA binding protein [Geminicoccaceae bacterium]|nr:UdgX family uracil-DNA binding protein [Geminicoccaceae bacterium]